MFSITANRIAVLAFIHFLLLIPLAECDGIETLPQNVTATARLSGTDGVGIEVTPTTFQITHIPEGDPSARVTSVTSGPQNLTGISLTITRTGIPIAETFHFLQLSHGMINPEDNNIWTSIAGPYEFVEQNIGDLIELRVETGSLDSPLTDDFADFPAPMSVPESEIMPVRTVGSSFLARVGEDDVIIPSDAPDQLIDINRLLGSLFIGLREEIRAGVEENNRIILGGPDGNGDFRMYFVPHIMHKGFSDSGRNIKGVGFIIAFTVTALDPVLNFATIGTAHVFLPISLLFEPDGADYRIAMDPFSLIDGVHQPENLDRIVVYANSPLGEVAGGKIAFQVRAGMVNALSNMTSDALEAIDLQLEFLAVGINSYLDDDRPIPDNFDVILIPEGPPKADIMINRIPFDEDDIPGKALRLVILE